MHPPLILLPEIIRKSNFHNQGMFSVPWVPPDADTLGMCVHLHHADVRALASALPAVGGVLMSGSRLCGTRRTPTYIYDIRQMYVRT
jgi:hypothetical protein